MTLDLVYFAWVRERVGLPKEQFETEARTVADLIEALKTRDEGYTFAFEDMSAIRVAVDQELVALDHPLHGAKEVAFFPPMTGG